MVLTCCPFLFRLIWVAVIFMQNAEIAEEISEAKGRLQRFFPMCRWFSLICIAAHSHNCFKLDRKRALNNIACVNPQVMDSVIWFV